MSTSWNRERINPVLIPAKVPYAVDPARVPVSDRVESRRAMDNVFPTPIPETLRPEAALQRMAVSQVAYRRPFVGLDIRGIEYDLQVREQEF